MTTPTGFTIDLTSGYATLLAAAGIGLTWTTSGAYTAGQTGIYDEVMPPAPDRTVTLTTYQIDDDPSLSDSVMGLQVISRGAPNDARDARSLDDAIFNVLQANSPVTLGNGIRVTVCVRTSGTSLGQDPNKRWARSSNYSLSLHRPSTFRS